jgi:hypothetical protein
MRIVLAALAACAISGCGPSETDGAATVAEGDEGTPGLGGPPPPCTATPLPITGVCNDAHPALFLAVDASLDTFARGCAWRTQELQTGADEAIVFRAQDCTGEMWDPTIYSWVGNFVKSRPAPVPEDQAVFALQVFNVGDGQTAEQVALQTLANAPEDQRSRCTIEPLNNVKVAGRAFELAPNEELTQEMQTNFPNEPWEACGPNGVTQDATQFWEGRKTRALFHITGQDQPGWDPASFTFYRKNPDGTWYKGG